MDEREQRIRERAHKLWEDEGRPDGRAEDHWVQAKEIVALEEGHPEAFKPIGTGEEPVEPIEALLNMGEFPTLTDQGEMQIPHRPETDLATSPATAPEGTEETTKAPSRSRIVRPTTGLR